MMVIHLQLLSYSFMFHGSEKMHDKHAFYHFTHILFIITMHNMSFIQTLSALIADNLSFII